MGEDEQRGADGHRCGSETLPVGPDAGDERTDVLIEPVQVTFLVPDHDVVAVESRPRQAAVGHLLQLPDRRAIAPIQHPQVAVSLADGEVGAIDLDPARRGDVLEPQQTPGVGCQGYHPRFVARHDQVRSDQHHTLTDVGQPLEFGAALLRSDGLGPDHAAVCDAQAGHAAVIVAHENHAAPDQQVGVAAQRQQRHVVIVDPQPPPADGVQPEDPPVDAAHDDDAVPRRRRRQYFRRHLGVPEFRASVPVVGDHAAVDGAHVQSIAVETGAAGEGLFRLQLPGLAARLGIYRNEDTFMVGRVQQARGKRGPHAQALLAHAVTDAGRPDLADFERGLELDQRRRVTGLGIAPTANPGAAVQEQAGQQDRQRERGALHDSESSGGISAPMACSFMTSLPRSPTPASRWLSASR